MKKLTTQNLKFFSKALKSYASLITCVAFYLSASPAFAKFEEHRAELEQIETYLNNIKNLSAKFIQETSDGNVSEGKFYLSRPGKMRIEYLAQPKIVIAVNGSILSYFDVELDEISRLSTNTTPASFLTRENISFSAKDVEITNVKKAANQIKVSVMKKNRKEAGEFSLIFNTNPLRFVKMEVKNDLDQIIGVTLSNPDFTSPIADKMFVIKKSSN
ncbi:MAG: outer membrane lipoprotein carrier protein LolA [Rickettsiales bacterium]|nr:outer membrane lipoprotein carrier protein LolA [Rickettsiales bacterium]